jgi:hypothetical protein
VVPADAAPMIVGLLHGSTIETRRRVAGADRMTIEEVVNQALLDEHADVIREAVKAVAAEMMELEVSELIGAERGERRPEGADDVSRPSDLSTARSSLAGLRRWIFG